MPVKEKRSVSGFLAKKLQTQLNSDYDYIEESNKRVQAPTLTDQDMRETRNPSVDSSQKASKKVFGASKNPGEISISPSDKCDGKIAHPEKLDPPIEQLQTLETELVRKSTVEQEDKHRFLLNSREDSLTESESHQSTLSFSKNEKVEIPVSFLLRIKNGLLSQRETQVILAILEKSDFKFDRPTQISYAALSVVSGVHQPHIPKTLGSLIDKGMIKRERNSLTGQNHYTIPSVMPPLRN